MFGTPDSLARAGAKRPGFAWTTARLTAALAVAAVAFGLCGLAAGSTGWSIDFAAHWWVVETIRAPRTLGAFLVGGLLGLAGAIAQGVFRNPLADPYLLGSAAGATLGIVLVLAGGGVAGVSIGFSSVGWLLRLGLVGAAFSGALGGMLLTLVLARGAHRPLVLLLAGVLVGVLLGAVANLLLLMNPEALRGAQVFLLGSTGFLGWHAVAPLAAVLAATLPIAVRFSRVLDALVLGDSTALSLGIAVPRIRLLLLVVMALCTGAAVAQAGLVAFVGLVAPHLVRRTVTVRHGALLLLAALAGGVLLLAADVLARVAVAPQELPVGLLTAVLGGAYLLLLLRRRGPEESW